MRHVFQRISAAPYFGRSGMALQPGGPASAIPQGHVQSWNTSWPRVGASSAAVATTADDFVLLQRLALAHMLVGICAALALAWQLWIASSLAPTPAPGLIVAIGGALALLFARLDRPALRVWARMTLVTVDLCAAGGILWIRGGEGWTLLVLLPPIALAIAFFAERGGALATMLAALVIVSVDCAQSTPVSDWMPSLLVFLGVAALIVAFLGIYSTYSRETSENLRWLLSDARTANDRLRAERQNLLAQLHSIQQAQEPLLHERARLADATAELTMLAQRVAQGDLSAAQLLQTLRPGVYGPLAELASTLAHVSRMAAGSWNSSTISTLDTPIRAQGQALESLDMLARALCVGANELVAEAQALESGVSLTGSGQYMRALWQLEQHLRAQATHLALLGTQLADIRTVHENLEMSLTRAALGAKTSAIFAASDVRAIAQYSGPQVSFSASAIRHAGAPRSDNGTLRWGNWPNQSSLAYNRGV